MTYLDTGELSISFVEDDMSVTPQDEKCIKVADYLTRISLSASFMNRCTITREAHQ